jgi:subtilisin family serine protease
MSKSKSKSKSKQTTFPNEYWRPNFEIYTHYRGLFDHGKELLDVAVEAPPQDGNAVADEIKELLAKQEKLNNDINERERRREEIEWEADHLSRSYQTALLTGPDAYPKTWQLMNTMSDLALIPVMNFKKQFARARPNQLEPAIKPLIEVPGHPAYPSGHSTQNFLIAHVLSEVIGDDAELIARVFAIARRVAENREWAGVHYASDTEAGEELAREIFPTMRRVFAIPIKDAIEEWQELELEQDEQGARQAQPVTMHGLQDAGPSKAWGDPFSDSHFREHQWNLENRGKPGIDINVRSAWEQLGIWQEGAVPKEPPVRVALIDLAIDFNHPALTERLDYPRARNLDYPNTPKCLKDADHAKLRELGWTKEEDVKKNYVELFGSLSSAHATACAGIIAADKLRVDRKVRAANGSTETIEEPGCLGIAPHCRVVPYRAMTLAEPVLHKRQMLARTVLEAATGVTFKKAGESEQKEERHLRQAPRWTVGGRGERPADILLFPLPVEPLPENGEDPLPLALAFAATRIPVIIPSGNRGTAKLSYLSVPGKDFKAPTDIEALSKLFDLDQNAIFAVFGEDKEAQEKKGEEEILRDLIFRMGNEAGVICVGACNDQGRRSRYSQYGNGLTLIAPSDDVLPSPREIENGAHRPRSIATTDLQGIGGYMQNHSNYTLSDNEFGFGGTSAAAAQVAGVVALMLQANPNLRPTDVHQILCETARVEDGQGNDLLVVDDGKTPSKPSAEFGHGLVDAARAVEEARRRVS